MQASKVQVQPATSEAAAFQPRNPKSGATSAKQSASSGSRVTPLDIVNVVYGLGVLRYSDQQLISAIEHHMSSRTIPPSSFTPHMISNLLYGFGHMLACPQHVLDALHEAASHHGYGTFTSQGVANSLYGLALMAAPNRHQLVASLAHVMTSAGNLSTWPEQHVANAMYALGLLSFEVEEGMWEGVVRELDTRERVASFSDTGLSCVVFGLSMLRVRAPALM